MRANSLVLLKATIQIVVRLVNLNEFLKNQPPKTGELPKTEFWITLPRQTANNFSKPSVREPNSDFHMTQVGLIHHPEESIETLSQKKTQKGVSGKPTLFSHLKGSTHITTRSRKAKLL